jgi:hypothetical protein
VEPGAGAFVVPAFPPEITTLVLAAADADGLAEDTADAQLVVAAAGTVTPAAERGVLCPELSDRPMPTLVPASTAAAAR